MPSLTFKRIESIKEPGRYSDGAGLFLLVGPKGGKSWIVRVQRNGKRREFGLGGYPAVSLSEARDAAAALCRKVKIEGVDPVAEKAAAKLEELRRASLPTFAKAAERLHAEKLPTWRNGKHSKQWLATLQTYAVPFIGSRSVDLVTAADVRALLVPIWTAKPETARRVHQRVVEVLTWAVASGYRDGLPLLSAKALSLPKQPRTIEHHAAMPWKQLPAFIKRLHAGEDGSQLVREALEFLILTAARSGEVRGMTWAEIDWDTKLWEVPASRMKSGRPHTVPLPPRAIEILEARLAERVAVSELVFPGRSLKLPMSDMTLKMALRRMDLMFDPHGFRSSFRDWVSDATNFPSDIAEAALAHMKGDKTEAAYARSTMLEKRRKLMEAWAAFLAGGAVGKVINLRAAAR